MTGGGVDFFCGLFRIRTLGVTKLKAFLADRERVLAAGDVTSTTLGVELPRGRNEWEI